MIPAYLGSRAATLGPFQNSIQCPEGFQDIGATQHNDQPIRQEYDAQGTLWNTFDPFHEYSPKEEYKKLEAEDTTPFRRFSLDSVKDIQGIEEVTKVGYQHINDINAVYKNNTRPICQEYDSEGTLWNTFDPFHEHASKEKYEKVKSFMCNYPFESLTSQIIDILEDVQSGALRFSSLEVSELKTITQDKLEACNGISSPFRTFWRNTVNCMHAIELTGLLPSQRTPLKPEVLKTNKFKVLTTRTTKAEKKIEPLPWSDFKILKDVIETYQPGSITPLIGQLLEEFKSGKKKLLNKEANRLKGLVYKRFGNDAGKHTDPLLTLLHDTIRHIQVKEGVKYPV